MSRAMICYIHVRAHTHTHACVHESEAKFHFTHILHPRTEKRISIGIITQEINTLFYINHVRTSNEASWGVTVTPARVSADDTCSAVAVPSLLVSCCWNACTCAFPCIYIYVYIYVYICIYIYIRMCKHSCSCKYMTGGGGADLLWTPLQIICTCMHIQIHIHKYICEHK
jgi:hypothetical protein